MAEGELNLGAIDLESFGRITPREQTLPSVMSEAMKEAQSLYPSKIAGWWANRK